MIEQQTVSFTLYKIHLAQPLKNGGKKQQETTQSFDLEASKCERKSIKESNDNE